MKIFIVLLLVGVGIFGLFILVSEPSDSGQEAENSNSAQQSIETAETTISYSKILEDQQNGALFLDVRTQEEYDINHYVGADLFPITDVEKGIYPETDKDNSIYVYCRSGNRSAQVTRLLESAGYTNIVDLGGLDEVEAIGGVYVN